MALTAHSTFEQDDAMIALANTLTEIVPQMVEDGPPLTPLMLAVSLVTAAGLVLRSLPMESRIKATADLQQGLETLLAVPEAGHPVS